jgi:hypothetical protein
MGTYKYSRITPTALVPRGLLLWEIPQNVKRNIKIEFSLQCTEKIPKYYFMAFYHGTSVRAGSPKAQTITQGTKNKNKNKNKNI